MRRVRAAAASHDLSLTEVAVMSRLAKGGPATTADLAQRGRHEATVNGDHHRGAGRNGMVERKPHPTDGRQVNIELTPKGVGVRKNAKDAEADVAGAGCFPTRRTGSRNPVRGRRNHQAHGGNVNKSEITSELQQTSPLSSISHALESSASPQLQAFPSLGRASP